MSRMLRRSGFAVGLAWAWVALGGCSEPAAVPTSPEDPYAWWEDERAERQVALDAYLADHEEELKALLYAPLGSFGIPRAAVDNFSAVMPDLWGPPEEKFAAVGLGPDLYDPSNPLPLGMATFDLAGVELVNISCGACHVGRVIGPDGEEQLLFGAPNTRFGGVFTAFEDTAADPRWSELGGGAVGLTMQAALLMRRQVEQKTIGDFTFSLERDPDAPDYFGRDQRGFFDSFSTIFALQTLPEVLLPGSESMIESVMPAAPAEADIMSVWRQSGRPAAEWDGSLPNPVYRNLAAAVGAMGFGFAVNYEGSYLAAQLTDDLPPPPYPFAVDGERAARGEELFGLHCAGCHHEGSAAVFPPAVTGTDPNRANAVTDEGRARLLTTLKNACTDPEVCDVPDAKIVADVSNPAERGYIPLPLDGIWARAPYLHNGSVPTLRHLLVPESRPAEFIRGSLHYDEESVGFAWDVDAAEDPYVSWYDTTYTGRANAGHESLLFLGIDWAEHPEELADLLEYLKTL